MRVQLSIAELEYLVATLPVSKLRTKLRKALIASEESNSLQASEFEQFPTTTRINRIMELIATEQEHLLTNEDKEFYFNQTGMKL